MAISAAHIRTTVDDYLGLHPAEKPALDPILELLDAGADLTDRAEMRGHATAGVVLVNRVGEVLFVHHVALDKWLLPGGHLENDTDSTLREAALRELTEETGIDRETVTALGEAPIHIDVHPIPANDAKGEGTHQHVDFRFLFLAAGGVTEHQEDEVDGSAWRGVSAIADDNLRSRVAAALRP